MPFQNSLSDSVRIDVDNLRGDFRFLGYIRRNSTDGIVRWSHMGDWAAPIFDNDITSIGGGAVSVVTPTRLVATAFFRYENWLMAQMAEVLAVGPGTEDEKMELAVGDKVIFSKYAGTDVKFNGEEVMIMSQRDILAIVE